MLVVIVNIVGIVFVFRSIGGGFNVRRCSNSSGSSSSNGSSSSGVGGGGSSCRGSLIFVSDV